MHVITLPQDTGISEVIKRLERVVYWSETEVNRGTSTAKPMELGAIDDIEEEVEEEDDECLAAEERKFKPIFNGRKINFENISGPKTLMVAWKRLISQSNNFKRESENFLRSTKMKGESSSSNLCQLEDEEESEEDCEVAEFCGAGEIYECENIKEKEKNSMHVMDQVNGEKIKAVIDTGATQSFIQQSLVQRMKLGSSV